MMRWSIRSRPGPAAGEMRVVAVVAAQKPINTKIYENSTIRADPDVRMHLADLNDHGDPPIPASGFGDQPQVLTHLVSPAFLDQHFRRDRSPECLEMLLSVRLPRRPVARAFGPEVGQKKYPRCSSSREGCRLTGRLPGGPSAPGHGHRPARCSNPLISPCKSFMILRPMKSFPSKYR